jgi:hypothetical protein
MNRNFVSLDCVDICRSPWSNTYDPPLEDGSMPSERLRKLEIDANHAFDQYREMYFEGGVSSVYLWDLDHGFAGNVLQFCSREMCVKNRDFYLLFSWFVKSCLFCAILS